MWLFLLSLYPGIVQSGDGVCERIEYCRLPKIDASKDCPTYGFDCSSTSELMQFNLSVDRGHSILTCRDKTAKLFVKQTALEQLKCDDGKWSYDCGKTKHALCAKPCDSCSVDVPNYVTIPSVSASVIGATSIEKPCAIAVCDGPGTHLLGVLEKNEATIEIPEKELKCTGKGWTDKADNKYDHAICGYYNNCTAPIPLSTVTPDPSFGPLQPVNVSHGAVFCPAGYQLVFSDSLRGSPAAHYTMYPIICSSSGNWQLLTVNIQVTLQAACVLECAACDLTRIQSQCRKHDKRCMSTKLESVSYRTSNSASCGTTTVCSDINFVPVFTTSSSNVTTIGVCSAATITTAALDTVSVAQCVRYSCKKDFDDIPDINSLACPNRTIASCRRANVHSSRITCPCGWQLVYATADNPTTPVQTEHLTCAASGSTMYWDSSPSAQMLTPVKVIGASCRRFNVPCLRCAPLKPLYAFHDQVFEYPASSDYNPSDLSTTTGCHQVSCEMSALFYNSLDTATSVLTCGDDLQWHAADGSVAHSFGCIQQNAICVPLEAIEGDTRVDIEASIVLCAGWSMKYELNGVTVPLGLANAPCCAGRYVYNYTTVIPNNAKLGCFE